MPVWGWVFEIIVSSRGDSGNRRTRYPVIGLTYIGSTRPMTCREARSLEIAWHRTLLAGASSSGIVEVGHELGLRLTVECGRFNMFILQLL